MPLTIIEAVEAAIRKIGGKRVHKVTELTKNTKLKDLRLNSLDIVLIIMELEETYKLEFDYVGFEKVDDIVEVVTDTIIKTEV